MLGKIALKYFKKEEMKNSNQLKKKKYVNFVEDLKIHIIKIILFHY